MRGQTDTVRIVRLALAWACAITFALHPGVAAAQGSGSRAEDEIRQAFREYDAALKRGDAEGAARFWAEEYFFVNPQGERLTRSQRLTNLKGQRTVFDVLEHSPDERIQLHGDVAVYSTTMKLAGQYSGRAHGGEYRAIVVLVRRDNRWQQVASQLTAVAAQPKK